MCRVTQKNVLKEFNTFLHLAKMDRYFARELRLKGIDKNGEGKSAFLAEIYKGSKL